MTEETEEDAPQTYEYAEDGSLCWLSHQWQPWKERKVEYGEDWEREIVTEQYRECYRCPKFQVRVR